MTGIIKIDPKHLREGDWLAVNMRLDYIENEKSIYAIRPSKYGAVTYVDPPQILGLTSRKLRPNELIRLRPRRLAQFNGAWGSVVARVIFESEGYVWVAIVDPNNSEDSKPFTVTLGEIDFEDPPSDGHWKPDPQPADAKPATAE